MWNKKKKDKVTLVETMAETIKELQKDQQYLKEIGILRGEGWADHYGGQDNGSHYIVTELHPFQSVIYALAHDLANMQGHVAAIEKFLSIKCVPFKTNSNYSYKAIWVDKEKEKKETDEFIAELLSVMDKLHEKKLI